MTHAIGWFALSLVPVALAAEAPRSAPIVAGVVTSTTTQAIHYPFLNGSSLVGFRGTSILPAASGQASVRGTDGRMHIHAHFKNLPAPSTFGPEYHTYVLWSVSPQGRATNLGEVVPLRGRAHLETSTGLHTFGLILTAEPHYAVTRVSHAVVVENVSLARDKRSRTEAVEARVELLGRASYAAGAGAAESGSGAVPFYLRQARSAVRIARAEGAEEMAPAEFRRAAALLDRAEAEADPRKASAVVLARSAAAEAEDARAVAAALQEARRLSLEQDRAREAQAKLEALRTEAEAARGQAAREALRAHEQERAAGEARSMATSAQLAARRKIQETLARLLKTRETDEGLLVTLAGVSFPSGSAALSPQARTRLARVAEVLKAYPGLRVQILGHADASGRPEVNERLSRQRAETVRAFLEGRGIASGDLEVRGMADQQPLAADDTPLGRRLNRRIELLLKGEPIGL